MGAEASLRLVLTASASVVSLTCTNCIEDPLQQFDGLLARLHQQLMLIFATIVLGHPKSAFQRLRGSS